ncbi:hypothetical protein AMJ85_04795 [candidate division BRC1 bacterium SM23_51]|nr:MAG: hypothetical protein AMJ85_04795 [candidate division BRC1 bacterium SM23_51]
MLIVCNGMLRSGSTLQYNITRSLVESMKLGRGEGFFEVGQLPSLEDRFHKWCGEESFHVIKMHDIPAMAAEMTSAGTMQICYIYRDIRDVAVSLKKVWKRDEEEIIESLDRAIATYYELKSMPRVLWQKYEVVKRDMGAAARSIASFIELDPPESLVESVVTACSLEAAASAAQRTRHSARSMVNKSVSRIGKLTRARAILSKLGVKESTLQALALSMHSYDKTTLLHPQHISSGEGAIGLWRTKLSEREIRTLSERYREWLEEAGYPLL